MPVPMTLSDLEWRDVMGHFSRRILVRRAYTRIVWPKTTKFGVGTHLGRREFWGVSHVRILRGGAQAFTKYFRIPTYAHTVWPTASILPRVCYCTELIQCSNIRVVECVCARVTTTPTSKGWGPSVFHKFMGPLPTPHDLTYSQGGICR